MYIMLIRNTAARFLCCGWMNVRW